MGRAGSCFDDAAAESFVPTLEWELFRLIPLATKHAAVERSPSTSTGTTACVDTAPAA